MVGAPIAHSFTSIWFSLCWTLWPECNGYPAQPPEPWRPNNAHSVLTPRACVYFILLTKHPNAFTSLLPLAEIIQTSVALLKTTGHAHPPSRIPPNKHTLVSFWLPSHYCLKDKKQALSCGTHEAAYIFIISVPYSTSLLYACLLASLSSPQFPWCLACLQTSSVPLHCSGIGKICTGTSLVKLNNFSLSLSQSLHLWQWWYFKFCVCVYVCFICIVLNFTWCFVLLFFFLFFLLQLSFGGMPYSGKPLGGGRKNFKGCMESINYNGDNITDLARRKKLDTSSFVSTS